MIPLIDTFVFDANLITQDPPTYLTKLLSIAAVQDIQVELGGKVYAMKSNNCGLLGKFV